MMSYHKIAVIYSLSDEAGVNIVKELLKTKISARVFSVKEDIVYADVKKAISGYDADFIIFASRHSSYKHEKILSVHAIGNFSNAQLGGNNNTLCPTNAFMLKKGAIILNNKKPKEYNIFQEATHHGPFCDVPCMFIEVGTTSEEWNDINACKAVAETIVELCDQLGGNLENKYVPSIGIGGLHSSLCFAKQILNERYAIGHICPKYMTHSLTYELLLQMIEKTYPKPEIILFDWKSIENKKEVIEISQKAGLPIKKFK